MSIRSSCGLNSKQWALLGEIVKCCPLSTRTIRRLADLRLLREAGLGTTQHTNLFATLLGMEARWYHSLR